MYDVYVHYNNKIEPNEIKSEYSQKCAFIGKMCNLI